MPCAHTEQNHPLPGSAGIFSMRRVRHTRGPRRPVNAANQLHKPPSIEAATTATEMPQFCASLHWKHHHFVPLSFVGSLRLAWVAKSRRESRSWWVLQPLRPPRMSTTSPLPQRTSQLRGEGLYDRYRSDILLLQPLRWSCPRKNVGR